MSQPEGRSLHLILAIRIQICARCHLVIGNIILMFTSLDLLTKISFSRTLIKCIFTTLVFNINPIISNAQYLYSPDETLHTCDVWLEIGDSISLVLALPRNISIGSEHETFALAYRSAAVKLYIFFLEKWCKCNVLRWMVSLFDLLLSES